ncbi:MAG TPA: NADP-dependent oxidoreductase [Solirubrobacteraceae bacterium]|nr:NADP-dependent oxidoreductase [Solirubrobacteraceae bacterium]
MQLVSYPNGVVRSTDFQMVLRKLGRLRPGEVLVRNTWMSIDPGLRLRLRAQSPDGYFGAIPLRSTISGVMTVGEVVASRADGFAPGDAVSHGSGWREFAVVEAGRDEIGGLGTLRRVDTSLAPPRAFLGVLGGTGLTAYAGMLRVANPRRGDVVWISAAAGAVGSLAAQLAKIRGHRVIGSAGSDEKVSYLLDVLGLDAAFNYKSGRLEDLLHQAAPEGIDVYFDNVGGHHLEVAIGALRRGGRIAMCGTVAEYDKATSSPGPDNLFLIVAKELTLQGLRGNAHVDVLPEMWRELGGLLRAGRLECPETIVDGLENAPLALARLMRGETTGKTLVRIAPEAGK